jgi:cytochrome c oxidase subunit 2
VKTRRLLRRSLPLVAFALLAVLNSGCAAKDAPLDWLRPAGPIARDIGNLWTLVFYMAVAVFFLVEGAIVYALIRFRHKKGDDELPKQTHGNTRLEIGWTIAPALILAVLAVPTLSGIFALARERPNSLQIEVTGQQWWWRYEYKDSKVVTANELHIPINRPVRLALKSGDIIHSYWVPALAGKQDVVPARVNHLTIQADRVGEFQGTCVEFCGLSHANMRLKVFAHTPADFDRWVKEQQAGPATPSGALAMKGLKVLEGQQCVSCHTIRGTKAAGTTAPDLTHFASRTTFAGGIFARNEENLKDWLTDAPAQKPGSKMPAGVATMGLSQDDITALIAYLQSLR